MNPRRNITPFVDRPPTIEHSGGLFFLTVRSGDQEERFVLTERALAGMIFGAALARRQRKQEAVSTFNVVPFPGKAVRA